MMKPVFASTIALEQALDGRDETYYRYFFALYHCSPDEPAGINDLRQKLREKYPTNATPVGRHFVLFGEPACIALKSYYDALSQAQTLPEDFRAYASERLSAIDAKHRKSQSLSIQMDLSEGQLSKDDRLDFYTCVALSNGQVVLQDKAITPEQAKRGDA